MCRAITGASATTRVAEHAVKRGIADVTHSYSPAPYARHGSADGMAAATASPGQHHVVGQREGRLDCRPCGSPPAADHLHDLRLRGMRADARLRPDDLGPVAYGQHPLSFSARRNYLARPINFRAASTETPRRSAISAIGRTADLDHPAVARSWPYFGREHGAAFAVIGHGDAPQSLLWSGPVRSASNPTAAGPPL
jgi:hypothetical protein